MIKTLSAGFCLLMLLAETPLMAQATSKDYLVLAAGDTLYGHVDPIDERGPGFKYYKKIRFTGPGGKKKKYKREDVSAFRVKNENYEGFWLSQSSQKILLLNPRYDIDPRDGEKHFLRVVSKGELSHYLLEWWEQGESLLMSMDLLKKEEDFFLMRVTQGLLGLKRKVLISYLQDCQQLTERVEQKQLNTVREVVDFYDENCLAKD